MIISLTCNYIPGDNRKHHCCSAWVLLLPPHHCLKVNPVHVNSPQPIPSLFLLPLSSFTTNSTFIIQTVFGGHDWANSSKHDISLQPRIEHMVTSAQFPVPISDQDFISLPCICYSQLCKSCGCTITALIMISIRANQGAPLWSCMLIWALMNLILVWFCHQLCDCIDRVNLCCNTVGGTCLDLPVRLSWGENVLAASKWWNWLQPAKASSDWAESQCSGAGKCFLFVPNSVLAPSISSHSAHRART